VVRNDTPTNQDGHEALKSYNADTNKITILDQTSGNDSGTTQFSDFYILSDKVFYSSTWTYSYQSGVTDDFRTIDADGQNKKILKTIDASQSYGYFPTYFNKPNDLYIQQVGYSGTSQIDSFYEYDGTTFKNAPSNVNDATFNQTSPTFLLSPSGTQTFWSEPRDGKNQLLIGDQNGDNSKQVATLSDYNTYGWYTDNYLLVTKDSDELYIMPTGGGTPLKISDYYKPANPTQNFSGYGGGYGGL
jgi:hypothetical protein